MTGMVHTLSASITSALGVKPSTVYVLRVENTTTRTVWHLRRCFSEFCDLRERMLVLLDGGTISSSTSSVSSSGSTSSAHNSPTTLSSTATLTARRLLALNPSLRSGRSGSAPGSTTNSPRSTTESAPGSGPVHARFPYLYAKFPRRQFFGSRSKKVIEQRMLALHQFLHEALWLLREVKTQHHIAMYFSLMTQLEVFLDCARHVTKTTTVTTATVPPAGVCPRFYGSSPLRNPTKQPALVVPFATTPERDSDAKNAADRARAMAARGVWHAPISNGHCEEADENDESDEEADDYEERKILKKTRSCFLHHEVRERRASNPASLFVATLQSRASERDTVVVSHAESWAARIEIAGIPPAEALRRRNSKNQAMVVKQYSSPLLSSGKTVEVTTTTMTTTTRFGMKDRSSQIRQGCRT